MCGQIPPSVKPVENSKFHFPTSCEPHERWAWAWAGAHSLGSELALAGSFGCCQFCHISHHVNILLPNFPPCTAIWNLSQILGRRGWAGALHSLGSELALAGGFGGRHRLGQGRPSYTLVEAALALPWNIFKAFYANLWTPSMYLGPKVNGMFRRWFWRQAQARAGQALHLRACHRTLSNQCPTFEHPQCIWGW